MVIKIKRFLKISVLAAICERLVETQRKEREFKNIVVPLKLKIGYV